MASESQIVLFPGIDAMSPTWIDDHTLKVTCPGCGESSTLSFPANGQVVVVHEDHCRFHEIIGRFERKGRLNATDHAQMARWYNAKKE
jgi:hypothetical protein